MPITPPRSCHDTAAPQLRLLPSPCVWLGPQWCQCGALSLLRPRSHQRQHRGQTQPRATPLAACPFRGWLGDCREGAIVLTGNTRSPAHAVCLTILPAAVTFLQLLNASPGSTRPCPCTWAHVTRQTTPANSNTHLNLHKEPTQRAELCPIREHPHF